MIIAARIKQLDRLIDASEDHDVRIAARRARAELLIELALTEPTQEDLAEAHRLAAEARDAEQTARNYAANQRVEIVTEIPRKS